MQAIVTRCRDLIARGKLPNGDQPMVLATADAHGFPDARYVLLKEIDDEGRFVFYTNAHSAKGKQLRDRPSACLVFYWPALATQLRVSGPVAEVEAHVADTYWRSRPRDSQLSSAASDQSAEIASREALLAKLANLKKADEGKDIPRPPHWTGFRVIPEKIEFWTAGEARLHHRELHRKERDEKGGGTWRTTLLQP